jgi:hypothetical protein
MMEIYTNAFDCTSAFKQAQQMFSALALQLQSKQFHSQQHGDIEQKIKDQGFEIMRLLFQGHLDSRFANEPDLGSIIVEGVSHAYVREHTSRTLNSIFGKVKVRRKGYSDAGTASVFAQDSVLNLCPDQYSDGLRKHIANTTAFESFERATEHIAATTATFVPNRQVKDICQQMSQDFDAFYKQRELGIHSPSDILVLSCDGKGIVMRQDDLRPQTQKAAVLEVHKKTTRLSKGEKRNRKRMATVATVYDIAPFIRSAENIMNKAEVKVGNKAPRPSCKRVWASVEKSSDEVIKEMFDEALRRDPYQLRPWVILVDGQPAQLKQISKHMKQRKIHATVVLDFIHVLEYLWKAAYCFNDENSSKAEQWVQERALKVLQGKAGQVAGGIGKSSTKRKMTKEQREAADSCAKYLLSNKAYLKYDTALSNGFPIATGVIEGACRYLIKDRLDITGARWRLKGAEAMLKIRALILSEDFEEYFTFHKRQERERNYPFHQDISTRMAA